MMSFTLSLTRSLMLVSALAMLAGCASESLIPDRRPDYRKSVLTDPLEVPPDLTASTIDDTLLVPELSPKGSASFSAYSSERTRGSRVAAAETVLPNPVGMRIEVDGDRRWLMVEQPPDRLWPRVKEFWVSNGFPLKREDPRIGVMETDWLENRADIPAGYIRDLLKRVLDVAYSAPTRDKFRVRLERIPKGTAVYLTHYGVEEVSRGGRGQQDTSEDINWQSRPRDPELEAEMLNRLMVYLGGADKRALAQAGSGSAAKGIRVQRTDVGGGQQGLIINENYSRAWGLVGSALDSSNFAVEQQNRSQGLYVVEYVDPVAESRRQNKGLLSKLAFWRDDKGEARQPGERYQVRLAGQGERTLVVVLDAQERPTNSPTAQQILKSLQEQIR